MLIIIFQRQRTNRISLKGFAEHKNMWGKGSVELCPRNPVHHKLPCKLWKKQTVIRILGF